MNIVFKKAIDLAPGDVWVIENHPGKTVISAFQMDGPDGMVTVKLWDLKLKMVEYGEMGREDLVPVAA